MSATPTPPMDERTAPLGLGWTPEQSILRQLVRLAALEAELTRRRPAGEASTTGQAIPIERLLAVRGRLVARLPLQLATQYSELVRLGCAPIVVRVEGACCCACGRHLPAYFLVGLRFGSRSGACPFCHRIVYLPLPQ